MWQTRVSTRGYGLTEVTLTTGALAEAEHWLVQSLAAHADPHQITLDTFERLLLAARLATVQQQYLRAALLFGLAEATHHSIQTVLAQPMCALADAALATVQAALEPGAFAEAFAAGQQIALAEALVTSLVASPKAAILSNAIDDKD